MTSSDTYGAEGYRVLPSGIAAACLVRLCNAIDDIQATVATLSPDLLARLVFERDLSFRQRGDLPPEAHGDAIFIIGDPPSFHPAFQDLLRLPALLEAARAALDSLEIEAHFMNVTIKRPHHGARIMPHRDFPNAYACPATSRFVRVMLCLDGMTASGGATTILPGSHRLSDDAARAKPDNAVAPDQPILCAPGDLVLLHPKILHAGGPNRSARPRRNVVIQLGTPAAPITQALDGESTAGCRLG